jgi:type II secretory pathway component HofQ
LTNILLHNYYYRYKEQRKQTKDLVENSNYTQARDKLDQVLAEHQTKYPDSDTKKDFNYGEKLIMRQARNHIQEALIDENNPDQYYVDPITNVVTLRKHSDQIKQILEYIPKINYQD